MLIFSFGLAGLLAGGADLSTGFAAGLAAGDAGKPVVNLMLGFLTSGGLGAAFAFSLTRSGRINSRWSTGNIFGCVLRYSLLQRAASGSQGNGGLVGSSW